MTVTGVECESVLVWPVTNISVVVPVTATFKGLLCDDRLFGSPTYVAMNVHVPTGPAALIENCAVPFTVPIEPPAGQFAELRFTAPVGDFDEVTVAVSIKLAPCATFVLGVESTVEVGTGP